jgi:hypothetical protein
MLVENNGKQTRLIAGDWVKLADGSEVQITATRGDNEATTRDGEINSADVVEIVKLVETLWRLIKKFFGR